MSKKIMRIALIGGILVLIALGLSVTAQASSLDVGQDLQQQVAVAVDELWGQLPSVMVLLDQLSIAIAFIFLGTLITPCWKPH